MLPTYSGKGWTMSGIVDAHPGIGFHGPGLTGSSNL